MNKSQKLYQIVTNFTKECKKGVCSIVDGSMPSISKIDDETSIMYLSDNIFYTKCMDSNQMYTEFGGEAAVWTYCNQELIAIRNINFGNYKEIHTLLGVIVDYLGQRYYAQAIIPGIVELTATLWYGSFNDGCTIVHDSGIEKMIKPILRNLGIGPTKIHPIGDDKKTIPDTPMQIIGKEYKEQNDIVEIYGPVDMEIVKSSDDKVYMMNLTMNPQDLVYNEIRVENKVSKEINLIRSEAIENYIIEKKEKMPLDLNLNINGKNELAISKEQLESDTNKIKNIGNYIINSLIPEVVKSLVNNEVDIQDGNSLTLFLHSRGINVHYLYKIVELLNVELKNGNKNALFYIVLCEIEIISRACKYAAKSLFKLPKANIFPALVAISILNSLFTPPNTYIPYDYIIQGMQRKGQPKREINIYQISHEFSVEFENLIKILQPKSIWAIIEKRITDHFMIKLTNISNPLEKAINPIYTYPLLNRVCLKCGIVLTSQNYDFTAIPFATDSILNILPQIKDCIPKPIINRPDVVQSIIKFINNKDYKDAYDYCIQMIFEIYEQCGYSHNDMIFPIHTLSLIFMHFNLLDYAIEHAKIALDLYKYYHGEGHSQISDLYYTLSLIYIKKGDIKTSIEYMKKCIYNREITSGIYNMKTLTNYVDYAKLLLKNQQLSESYFYFNKVYSICSWRKDLLKNSLYGLIIIEKYRYIFL